MQIAVSSEMTFTFSITTSTDIAQDGDINFKKSDNNKSEVNLSTFIPPTCATSINYIVFITFEYLTELLIQKKPPPPQQFHLYIKNISLTI